MLPALSVPMLLPGATMPPTVKAATSPLPPRDAPLDTVTALALFVPFTSRRPALMVVAPLKSLVPESV